MGVANKPMVVTVNHLGLQSALFESRVDLPAKLIHCQYSSDIYMVPLLTPVQNSWFLFCLLNGLAQHTSSLPLYHCNCENQLKLLGHCAAGTSSLAEQHESQAIVHTARP